jgi:hypothetical protein
MTKCVFKYIYNKKGKYPITLYILPLLVISLSNTNLKPEKLEKKLNTMKLGERDRGESGSGKIERQLNSFLQI